MNIKITLDALQVLDAIDRKGSFAAAAAELFRVPSALTYSISKLEQDLGAQIFDRSGHRAVLTEAGRKLLDDGRQLLDAAAVLEAAVQQVATGWETELVIAVGDAIPLRHVYALLEEFYCQQHPTRIKLVSEVYGGIWDALVTGRADLAIGAANEAPTVSGYRSHQLGMIEFVFAVAPGHALAKAEGPLTEADIKPWRVVAAADTSRQLAPKTSGLVSGQDVLTVPGMEAKIEAQRQGLGVGYVPRHLVAEDLRSGRLVECEVAGSLPEPVLYLAWHATGNGNALQWFVERIRADETWMQAIINN